MKQLWVVRYISIFFLTYAITAVAQQQELTFKSLEGCVLFADEVKALQTGTLQDIWQSQLHTLQKKESLSLEEQQEQKRLSKQLPLVAVMEEALFWHHTIPTTGLRSTAPSYPYIPHMFSLWEWAPHKGKGARVAIIDTGLAGFQIEGYDQFPCYPDIVMNYQWPKNFNLVGDAHQPSLDQILYTIKKYSDPKKFLPHIVELRLPEIIKEFLMTGVTSRLVKLLSDIGLNKLFKNKELTPYGIKAVAEISQGMSLCTLAHMNKPVRERVIVQLLPTAKITSAREHAVAGHGTHVFRLLAGQHGQHHSSIGGIVPAADVFMIKAFGPNGVTNKSTLIRALKKSQNYGAQIVNLSLKIADELDLSSDSTKELQALLSNIKFPVCASGNDGLLISHQSYPARWPQIFFSVGAFACLNNRCAIPPFVQHDADGPHFVAPGFNLVSTGFPDPVSKEVPLSFISGTSIAAPLVSGLLALIVGEFGDTFSQEQIELVCKTAAIKMHQTPDWQSKTTYGVIDTRTVLCMLHVLAILKKKVLKFNILHEHLINLTHTVLVNLPQQYADKYLQGTSFSKSFMEFYAKAEARKKSFDLSAFIVRDYGATPKAAVEFIAQQVMQQL